MINKTIIKIFLAFLIIINIFIVLKVSGDSNFAEETFTVDVGSITSGIGMNNILGSTLDSKTDNLLMQILEILMVAIGVIALFVVSVGAGYMIMYNGNEEFLKKGRNMIFTGFLALFIALSSYYIMNLVKYILYD